MGSLPGTSKSKLTFKITNFLAAMINMYTLSFTTFSIFIGMTDTPLTKAGINEAKQAGGLLMTNSKSTIENYEDSAFMLI